MDAAAPSRRRPSRRTSESGFALLLVFAMAAIIGVMLYMEMPSTAFEAQREKEQLLIERGEEYKRAIQLFCRKMKIYPPSLDALDGTNNVRFIRRRYNDPMTGKKEWRVIHVVNGVFTDSLTQKKKKETSSVNTFITEGPAIGSTQPQGTGPVNAWKRMRRSVLKRGSPGDNPGAEPGADLPGMGTPNEPAYNSITAAQQSDPNAQPGGSAGQTPGIPGSVAYPGQADSGAGSQFGQQGAAGPAFPGAGGGIGRGSNDATRMIQDLLTRPRPGGLSGVTGMAGMPTGNGIAGVASMLESDGIKIYNEKSKYNEWEFLYDLSKDKTLAGRSQQGGIQGGTPVGNGMLQGTSSGQMGSFSTGGFSAPTVSGGMQGGFGQVPGYGGFGRPGTPTSAPTSSSGSSSGSGSSGFGSGFSSGGFGSGFGGSGSGTGTTTPKPTTPGQTPGQGPGQTPGQTPGQGQTPKPAIPGVPTPQPPPQ